MTTGYPDSVPALGHKIDHEGCLYGQQSRQMTKCLATGKDCIKLVDDEGCTYGKETRWIVERVDAAVTKILWLCGGTILAVMTNIGVQVVLRK